jgi:hypothetical protein
MNLICACETYVRNPFFYICPLFLPSRARIRFLRIGPCPAQARNYPPRKTLRVIPGGWLVPLAPARPGRKGRSLGMVGNAQCLK